MHVKNHNFFSRDQNQARAFGIVHILVFGRTGQNRRPMMCKVQMGFQMEPFL